MTEDLRAKDQALLRAAKAGDQEAVRSALLEGARVDARGEIGQTSLMLALAASKEAVADLLIQSGADPLARDDRGITTLHFAAQGNLLSAAERLVGKGIDVETLDARGNSPLHFAAGANAREVAGFLVTAGANPLRLNAASKTPIDLAQPDLAKILEKHAMTLPRILVESRARKQTRLVLGDFEDCRWYLGLGGFEVTLEMETPLVRPQTGAGWPLPEGLRFHRATLAQFAPQVLPVLDRIARAEEVGLTEVKQRLGSPPGRR